MNQENILLALHYLPNIQYFSKLFSYSQIWMEGEENYRKASYRNRCHLASDKGIMRLSIPLKKGKNQQQVIREVQIAYDLAWQNQHWRSICTAYGNAPFFDHYAEEIHPFYQKRYKFLFDFNLEILQEICSLIALEPKLVLSKKYQATPDKATLDFRNKIHPKLDRLQEDRNFDPPKYRQVFEEKTGFLANLSVLDLLFCTGPQTPLILENAFRK